MAEMANKMTEDIADLAFVETGKAGKIIDFWKVSTTGDWGQDNTIGRSYAKKLVEFMRSEHEPFLLGYVVRDMIKKGHFGGIETGFCSHLATRLI